MLSNYFRMFGNRSCTRTGSFGLYFVLDNFRMSVYFTLFLSFVGPFLGLSVRDSVSLQSLYLQSHNVISSSPIYSPKLGHMFSFYSPYSRRWSTVDSATVGNHVTFYTYIRTERVSIFVIICLMLNEFSYRKAQIPHRFCS